MKIEQINQHLNALKLEALSALGVDASFGSKMGLAPSPNPDMGDWGFPVFALQGPLKDQLTDVPGKERAAHIAHLMVGALDTLLHTQEIPLVESVNAEGPYVNLALNTNVVAQIVIKQALEQQDTFGLSLIHI